MLSRQHRLAKRKDFDTLFKRGKLVYGRHAQMRVIKTNDQQPVRVAIVISAKTEKSAVRRNRVKRQAREVVRLSVAQLKPGFDAAITLRSSFVPLTYDEKRHVIVHLLTKGGLLKA